MTTAQLAFPSQAVSDSVKRSKEWQHECIDSGISAISDKGETSIRKSRFNKLKNYNFWQFRLDKNEMKKVADPFGINPEQMPVNMKHYPVINSKIDVLAGEELKRRTEWVVRALSPDIYTEKENQRKDMIFQSIMQQIQDDKEFDPFKAKKELEKLDEYIKYTLQDEREIKSDRILQWLWRNPEFDFRNSLNRCFYDLMIAAEEVGCIDIIGDEPIPRKCNPLNVYTLGMSDSIYIDESDIIVEEGYYSPGYVIDHYNEDLSENDVKRIQNKDLDLYHNATYSSTNWLYPTNQFGNTVLDTELIEVDRQYGNQYGNMNGIYVARVVWKSLRKLGDLKYYDQDGLEQHMIVPEGYKPDKSRGEEVEWYWETEWWEGTRILRDIYVKVRPVPGNKCPYVGIVANVNTNRAMSLLDKAKEFNMLYDILMYNLELMYATYTGPMIELDLAKKPDEWDENQWLYYARIMKFLVVDSFREANKGAAMGTLAGNMNTTGKVLNPDIGNYIQHTMQLAMMALKAIDDATGVTPARQGDTSQIETVGGTERSVVQSANNTEYWFNLHTKFIERYLNRFLHFAKYAWKDKKKQLHYIVGDLSTVIEEINGIELQDIDPCVYVTSSPEDIQLLQLVRQAAADSVKQGSGTMSMLIDTYYSRSMAEIRRKIQINEANRQEAEQQQNEAQQKQAQAELEFKHNVETEKLRIMEEDSIRKAEVQLQVASMKLGSEVPVEYEEELEKPLDREKFEFEKYTKERDLQIKEKTLDLKNKQLADNKELSKEKLVIDRQKARKVSSKK